MFRKTMEEYEADTRKKLVIDIREKEAFDKETMPGALHMDSETLKQQIKELTKDQTPVYLLCHTGQQSDALAEDFEGRISCISAVKASHSYASGGFKGTVLCRCGTQYCKEVPKGNLAAVYKGD